MQPLPCPKTQRHFAFAFDNGELKQMSSQIDKIVDSRVDI